MGGSHGDSDGAGLGRVEFEPAVWAADGCRVLKAHARAKGLSVQMDVAEDLPPVVGDYARLRRVLLGVGSNAVKFTQRGGVAVRVSADARSPRVVLRTSVADTGVGMAPKHLDRLLAPPIPSAGGLGTCRQLVAGMGGSISVESSLGAGTTFTFVVPLQLAAGVRERARLLLAIDDAADRAAAQALFAEADVDTDAVDGAHETVDAWLLTPYDLVLTSCRGPGSGAERDIRALERVRGAARTPIIVVASAAHGACPCCQPADVDGTLATPLTRAALKSVVGRHVRAFDRGRHLVESDAACGPDALPLDRPRLRALAAGDEAFETRILEQFLGDATRLMEVAEQAASGGDRRALLRALDSLKGTGANLGATALSRAAGRAESLAASHGCEAARGRLPSLRAELAALARCAGRGGG